MFFLWPDHLWLMLGLPLLAVLYLWLLHRPRKQAVRYSSVCVARSAAQALHWRRHLPPALLLLACTGLLLAAARPTASVPLPWIRTSIMLAMDVSLSMRIDDVKPTRLAAAQDAAKAFLRELPRDIEVGLVTFAASSQVAQRPTREREPLIKAIDAFQMQAGTAVGDAIAQCLAELFPDHGIDVSELSLGTSRHVGRSLDDKDKPAPKEITPVPPGSYRSAAIILLSDGRRTTGMDTLEAARMAADRGVRIDVVGLGSESGAGTIAGMPIVLQLDEPTLREVARLTSGEYHRVGSAEGLRGVYESLRARVQVQARETELTALFAWASALVGLAAGGLSLLWAPRIA